MEDPRRGDVTLVEVPVDGRPAFPVDGLEDDLAHLRPSSPTGT